MSVNVEEIVRQLIDILHSAAGKIIELPDNATHEQVVQALKEFARRILSIGKEGGK